MAVSSSNQIFLSYSHKNKDVAQVVYDFLVSHDFKVWMDVASPRHLLYQEIVDGIDNSQVRK